MNWFSDNRTQYALYAPLKSNADTVLQKQSTAAENNIKEQISSFY